MIVQEIYLHTTDTESQNKQKLNDKQLFFVLWKRRGHYPTWRLEEMWKERQRQIEAAKPKPAPRPPKPEKTKRRGPWRRK